MFPEIEAAVRGFREIYIAGIPFLLKQNETSFLSFLCVVSATDALAGYRYQQLADGDKFRKFVTEYFPPSYATHVPNLWFFRCRMLHNFSPAYFSLTHAASHLHLQLNPNIGDYFLSDESFFDDMRSAAEKYFFDLQSDVQLQDDMVSRLHNTAKGGAIFIA